jgi:hypothetical protein
VERRHEPLVVTFHRGKLRGFGHRDQHGYGGHMAVGIGIGIVLIVVGVLSLRRPMRVEARVEGRHRNSLG